jgi:hypothetical protein
MDSIAILGRYDAGRPAAERLITNVFRVRYGAMVSEFPETIAAKMDKNGLFVCAAGLRFASNGFFSERYLDEPVERAINRLSGDRPSRDRIFEVSSLASREPGLTVSFIFDIVLYGQNKGFEWSFFTLTRRLLQMLTRIGISPYFLGNADRRRVPHFQTWGSYYEQKPAVFALPNPKKVDPVLIQQSETTHALSL